MTDKTENEKIAEEIFFKIVDGMSEPTQIWSVNPEELIIQALNACEARVRGDCARIAENNCSRKFCACHSQQIAKAIMGGGRRT